MAGARRYLQRAPEEELRHHRPPPPPTPTNAHATTAHTTTTIAPDLPTPRHATPRHRVLFLVTAAAASPPQAGVPMIALACAHWAKFASAVGRAIGPEEAAKLEMPEPLASLHGKPTRVAPLPNDVSAVRQHIHATLAQAHESSDQEAVGA